MKQDVAPQYKKKAPSSFKGGAGSNTETLYSVPAEGLRWISFANVDLLLLFVATGGYWGKYCNNAAR
jgi:hypothetical protein